MIRAAIRNIRGCERADVEVSRIALIAGDNGAGKSSILQAIGCAIAGQALILPELGKKGAAALVRSGAQTGSVAVFAEGGKVTLSYPKAELASEGEPPRATPFAAGLLHVLDLDEKARAKILGEYLKTAPTFHDLSLALADADVDERTAAEVWKSIETHGWDGAHARAKEDGARMKGAWENVTGARYGSRVGASWTPEGWLDEFNDLTPDVQSAAIAEARKTLEGAIVNAAVSQAEIDRLAAIAANVEDAERAFTAAQQRVADAEKAEAEARKALEAVEQPVNDRSMPCPHCGKGLHVHRVNQATWELRKAEEIDATENERRRKLFAEVDGKHSRAKDELASARRALRDAEVAHTTAANAAADLAAARQKSSDAGAVDAARQALAAAEARQKMLERKMKADDLHQRITRQAAVVDALSENGVRRAKLLKVLDLFNRDRLAPLSTAAGWKLVALGDDLMPTYGGRAYPLLSVSEQYRVRVVFQVAMAQLDGSSVILIDGADVLDANGRNGLFGMLLAIEQPVTVGMTISKLDQAPDLAAAGIGATYWVSGGTAAPLGEIRKEAA